MTVSLLWIRTLICSLLSVLPFLHVKDFRRKELYVSIIGSCMILYVRGFLEDRIPEFELLPAYSIYPVLMWIPFRFLSSLLLVTIRSHAYIYTIIIVFGYPAVFLYFLDTRVISRKQRQREQALELNMHLSRNAIDAQMKQTQEILKDRHRQRKDCLTLIGMLESNEINQAKMYLQNEMIKEDAVLVQGNEYLDAMMRYLQVEFPYVVFTVEADLMPGEGVDSSDLAILVMTVIQILLPEGKSSSGIITVHIRKQGEMAVIRVLREHHEKTGKPASIDTEELAIVNHLIRRYHGFSNNGYAAGDVRIALDNTVLTSS